MRSIPFIKLDRLRELPTTSNDLWGQLRVKPGDSATVPDILTFYRKNSSGVIGPASLMVSDDTHDHLTASTGGELHGYSQNLGTGWQNPPGPGIVNTTSLTTLVTQQCAARYLGQCPEDATSVVIKCNVTTLLATSIVWAEVALASAPDAISNLMTTLGFTSVTGTFNTTGLKTTTVTATIPAGAHVFCLMGSEAIIPFQVRATIGDELSTGNVRFLAATRPSTMVANTAFTTSSTDVAALGLAFRFV